MMNTVYVKAKRQRIRSILNHLPQMMNIGSAQDAAQALMTRLGLTVLGRIHKAFIDKARGGTDEAGYSWQPLKPETIAYSRRHPGVPKASVRAAKSPSWMLTERQRKRWWALYRSFAGTAPGGAGFHAAGANHGWAAARAWLALRAEMPYETLLSKYGGTQVEILRDTDLLLNSLSPGVPGGTPNQVFRLGVGEVIVGTNRKWASAHHRGIPGRLPQRRLWPPPSAWPKAWWDELAKVAKEGLVDVIRVILERT